MIELKDFQWCQFELCWSCFEWRSIYRRFSNAQVSKNIEIIIISV